VACAGLEARASVRSTVPGYGCTAQLTVGACAAAPTKGVAREGLGLAMVYGMIQRHSAELEIDSEPGAGTAVRLIFPVVATSAAAASAVDMRPLRRLRILIVDDDPLLLRSLQDTLERDGHLIDVAHGGQAAIDEFGAAQQRGTPFDAVVTDLGMPHIDGRTVATAIKSLAPTTPVILLTGWGYRLLADAQDCATRFVQVRGPSCVNRRRR
jgi:CheY-like chemotaxis protein